MVKINLVEILFFRELKQKLPSFYSQALRIHLDKTSRRKPLACEKALGKALSRQIQNRNKISKKDFITKNRLLPLLSFSETSFST
jgi:hypothetical protein